MEYTYVDRSPSGGYVPIEELETLAIAYPVEIGRLPYPALEELATGGMVVDHVRIYRVSERPINEVIVIDQCPSDLRGDHFVLYLPTRGGVMTMMAILRRSLLLRRSRAPSRSTIMSCRQNT